MIRTHYENGVEITCVANGCDSCEAEELHNVVYHEIGCENSWQDNPSFCPACGYQFYATVKDQFICNDCCNDYHYDDYHHYYDNNNDDIL